MANIPRFFFQTKDQTHLELVLPEDISHKLATVLRCKIDDQIILFDGSNNEALSQITNISRRNITVKILETYTKNVESKLKINLGQAIAKSVKMDFIIQKATELGVHSITPLITERTIVQIKEDKKTINKVEHWQKIAIAACEQSGRAFVPTIEKPVKFSDWAKTNGKDEINKNLLNIMLDPRAKVKLNSMNIDSNNNNNIRLLIGPEGGLSKAEELLAESNNFIGINLGPRILRTETAALAAICALQTTFGDMR